MRRSFALGPGDGVPVGTYATGHIPLYLAFDGAHVWTSTRFSNNLTKL